MQCCQCCLSASVVLVLSYLADGSKSVCLSLAAELEFVQIIIIVVVMMVMVVVITCLLNHYKLSARSFISRHSQGRRRDENLSSVSHTLLFQVLPYVWPWHHLSVLLGWEDILGVPLALWGAVCADVWTAIASAFSLSFTILILH